MLVSVSVVYFRVSLRGIDDVLSAYHQYWQPVNNAVHGHLNLQLAPAVRPGTPAVVQAAVLQLCRFKGGQPL